MHVFQEVIQAVAQQNKDERDIFLMGDFNFDPNDKVCVCVLWCVCALYE